MMDWTRILCGTLAALLAFEAIGYPTLILLHMLRAALLDWTGR